jgi:hypothetical protein
MGSRRALVQPETKGQESIPNPVYSHYHNETLLTEMQLPCMEFIIYCLLYLEVRHDLWGNLQKKV